MRRRTLQPLLAKAANRRPNTGVRNLGRTAPSFANGPIRRPLPPNDPDAVAGNQPITNVITTDEDYTMGQNDFAVIAQGPLTVTLNPNPLTATPVIVIADTGTATVDGPIQGGPQSVPQGKIGFFSYSPLTGTWSVNIDGCEGQVTVAPNYYIDSVHGNDNNPGTSLQKPLKTWAQLQTIFGQWTTIQCESPTVTIHLLSAALLPTDPITFFNFLGSQVNSNGVPSLGSGLNLTIEGQPIVLSTQTLASVINEVPASNIPNQITVTGFVWTPYIGKAVVVANGPNAGSRAFVAADLGGGTAQVSEWVDGSGMSISPAAGPVVGNRVKITDYTNVIYDSLITIGWKTPASIAGEFQITQVHATVQPSTGFGNATFFGWNNEDSVLIYFSDTIHDAYMEFTGVTTYGYYNVCCTGPNFLFATIFQISGLYVPSIGNEYIYPGAIQLNLGGGYVQAGNTMFYGNLSAGFFPADFVCHEEIQCASLSFWNCYHTFVPNPGCNAFFNQDMDNLLGEFGGPSLWGTGNENGMPMFPSAVVNFMAFSTFPAPPNLPVLQFGLPGDAIGTFGDVFFNASHFPLEASAWNVNAVPPAFTALQTVTWASLITPVPGGFQTETGAAGGWTNTSLANAQRPDSNVYLRWTWASS
jgi:hypothetical protein